MLDIKFIRENPDLVKENIKKKFQDNKLELVDKILDLDEKRARATTIFCMLPIVFVTGILYNLNMDINFEVAIRCALGGVIGSIIGSHLLHRLSEKYLNLSFIIFLVYSIIRMSFK